ncbi:MAG TPA: hypothetical protein VHB21_05300, partial [Minicystis sp.]|nr:hypothetical protein [Minicystis sp.]
RTRFGSERVPVAARDFSPARRDNLGVAALASRPARGTDDERDVLVAVATSSDRSRRARVTVTAEGREIAAQVVDVPAHGEADVHARVLAAARRVAARVEPADGVTDALAADDAAELATDVRPKPRVVVVGNAVDAASPAAFFVDKAVEAAGVSGLVHATPDTTKAMLDGVDVVVALEQGPAVRPSVPTLYVGTRHGALPVTGLRDVTGDAAHLRSLEAHDPLLRGVALDGVTIEHATAIDLPAGARGLVDLDGGTVVASGGAGASRFVYLGIDPSRSDLALRVAFPVLVANALHELSGAGDVVTADTVARSEIALAEVETAPVAIEPTPRWRLPIAPAGALALFGAVLLALEAWAWRKGWANA